VLYKPALGKGAIANFHIKRDTAGRRRLTNCPAYCHMGAMTVRRAVTVGPRVPRSGGVKLWAFGLADLAALFGCSERTVRRMTMGYKEGGRVVSPALDPADLEAVCRLWAARGRI
jgi:hypothetical protein